MLQHDKRIVYPHFRQRITHFDLATDTERLTKQTCREWTRQANNVDSVKLEMCSATDHLLTGFQLILPPS